MREDNSQIALIAGSLFSRLEELRLLLTQLEESGCCRREFEMVHRANDGTETKLVIHIEGLMFTMMPIEKDTALRLDISNS